MTKTSTSHCSPKRPPKLSPLDMAIFQALSAFVGTLAEDQLEQAINAVMEAYRAEKSALKAIDVNGCCRGKCHHSTIKGQHNLIKDIDFIGYIRYPRNRLGADSKHSLGKMS